MTVYIQPPTLYLYPLLPYPLPPPTLLTATYNNKQCVNLKMVRPLNRDIQIRRRNK